VVWLGIFGDGDGDSGIQYTLFEMGMIEWGLFYVDVASLMIWMLMLPAKICICVMRISKLSVASNF